MRLDFDLSGRVSLSIRGAPERADGTIRATMDPFAPVAGVTEPDVILTVATSDPSPRSLIEVQNPARDGLVTGSDGSRVALVLDGRKCTLADPLDERPACFEADRGFPLSVALRAPIRSALQLALPRRGAVAVHAASVELDGAAVLIAGWSESGKTETALALMEQGAAFLSDKWTLLGGDGDASAFPIGVGIRRWVLTSLPRLRRALPSRARAQLAAAGAVDLLSRPLRRNIPDGRLAALAREALERGVALADRAALSPSELRKAYGQQDDPCRRVPARAVAVLETVPESEVVAEPLAVEEAATRLARSAAYERRDWFALWDRGGFLFPERRADTTARATEADREILQSALAKVRVIRVRAPFPTDPRRVAAALRASL